MIPLSGFSVWRAVYHIYTKKPSTFPEAFANIIAQSSRSIQTLRYTKSIQTGVCTPETMFARSLETNWS